MGQHPLDPLDLRLERGRRPDAQSRGRSTATLRSSSGSGAAVAAGIVRFAIGTETDGSVTCPAAINGIVGLKPTVGLVSRTHIVPISHSQDTAGPMAATVREAAELLTVIAGSDPADPATRDADGHKTRLCRGARRRFAEGQAHRRDALRLRLRHRRGVRRGARGAARSRARCWSRSRSSTTSAIGKNENVGAA